MVEKDKTGVWLAEQLGVTTVTVSKWCANTCQPDLVSLMKIAKLLDVDINELIRYDSLEKKDLDIDKDSN